MVGFGLGQYEKGIIHVMQLPTHGDKDKRGLGFRGPRILEFVA